MEKQFKEFEGKYLDTKQDDYFSSYLKQARDIIRDLKYFDEHIKRTKITKRYGFLIIPVDYGICDWFTRELFQYRMSWYGINSSDADDQMVMTLKLHDITNKLFDMTEYGNNVKIVEEITKWSTVLGYYSSINLRDHIHHFCGSSHGCKEIAKEWDRILSENKTNTE